MSNLNLQKLREWVWPWPWTFKFRYCWQNIPSKNCSRRSVIKPYFKISRNESQSLKLSILCSVSW